MSRCGGGGAGVLVSGVSFISPLGCRACAALRDGLHVKVCNNFDVAHETDGAALRGVAPFAL
jgi:hypothetical protein